MGAAVDAENLTSLLHQQAATRAWEGGNLPDLRRERRRDPKLFLSPQWMRMLDITTSTVGQLGMAWT